jgi:UDP-glucuronate 4-epimerase
MAYFSFVDKYFAGESIKIFNNGDFANDMYRDFTYVDDIVEGVLRVTFTIDDNIKYKILNIGNNNPVKLMTFISTLEKCLSKSIGREVVFNKEFESIKMGDVWKTYASTRELEKIIEFKPDTPLEKGLQEFTDWYCSYYKIK